MVTSVSQSALLGAQTRIAAKCTEAALGAQTSHQHHYVVELILVILKAFPTSTVAPAGKPCQARLWGGFQNFFASIAAVILWHGKSSHTQKKENTR